MAAATGPLPAPSAEDWQQRIEGAMRLVAWPYDDAEPIAQALTAGDYSRVTVTSADREGNRGAAQYGEQLVQFVVMTFGRAKRVSREEQQRAVAAVTSKEACASLARSRGLDLLVKPSIRQSHLPPQPTVLKNALFALVAAVYEHSNDMNQTVHAMYNLGLISTKDWPPSRPQPDEGAPDVDDNSSGDWLFTDEGWPDQHLSHNNMLPLESALAPYAGSFTPLHTEEALACFPSPVSMYKYAPHTNQLFFEPRAFDPTSCTQVGASPVAYSPGTSESSDSTAQHLVQPLASERRSKKRKHGPVEEEINCLAPGYLNAIVGLPTERRQPVAKFVAQIGCPKSLISVKGIIRDMRVNDNFGAIHADPAAGIARARTAKERLDAIAQLDIRLAHLRLARRMHIYIFWNESRELTEPDPFIIQSGPPPLTKQPRGNPNHRKVAERTKAFRDLAADDIKRAKRLRRVGDRLGAMVDVFGLGVLALLSEEISDEMILAEKDVVFSQIIKVIHHFEGAYIQGLSDAATPIVNMLLTPPENFPHFQIEVVSDEEIRRLPRGSPELVHMLAPIQPAHVVSPPGFMPADGFEVRDTLAPEPPLEDSAELMSLPLG